MANYTRIETCAAIGESLAVQHQREGGSDVGDPGLHVGPDSSWEQRRAFEWAYLAACFRYQGDEDRAAYAQSRVAELKRNEFNSC